MLLHELLKHYRILNEMSQEELANKLFVTRQAVSKWEQGDSYPDLENIILLSDLYDISIDELLRGARFLKKPYHIGHKASALTYLANGGVSIFLASIIYQNAGVLSSVSMGIIYFVLGLFILQQTSIEFGKHEITILNVGKWYQRLNIFNKRRIKVYDYNQLKSFKINYRVRPVRHSLDWGPDDFHIQLEFEDGLVVNHAMTKRLEKDLPILVDFLEKKNVCVIDELKVVEKLIKGVNLYTVFNHEKNG
ncbi:helix-turn-helix domain-containing protein [Erysipelothrix urinaevulpis]|uniref:helix-turn-helix domain-containing protein n=1 Tax=Erysipelothrix urinaevulpis TaxID=2683717 RepID=UPI00135837C7|nr:helix-turn-helix transcriptional regulator [Erysipelothrix urinaevulpis]